MKLTLYEFNALPFELKEYTAREYGTYLVNVNDKKLYHALFTYCDYYIEIISNRRSLKTKEINAFKKGIRLERYLEAIDINQ